MGLDVGTTNSAVAVRADGRFVVIPPPGQVETQPQDWADENPSINLVHWMFTW